MKATFINKIKKFLKKIIDQQTVSYWAGPHLYYMKDARRK